jgi:four helix bundle protein
MQDFKKLKVWDKSHLLALAIYKKTASFPKDEIYGLTSQIRRASVSIPANIAEGCGKFNQKDIIRFFQISLGSIHETEYYLILCKDLNYLNLEDFDQLNSILNEVKAMLISLIKKSKEKADLL